MSVPGRRVRVLVAKAGLDGHDRGAKVVVMALRDAGMEVIYSGLRRTTAQIVAIAVQEDVDVIGLSVLSGAHIALTRRLMAELRAAGLGGVRVVVGGTIATAAEEAELRAMGVADVVLPGTSLAEVAARVARLGHREEAKP